MADASSNLRESTVDQDLSGRTLDDFHLLRRLARGAMAEVYLAEQTSLRRQVADSSFYLAFNAWEEPLQFRLPGPKWGGPWRVVVDTADSKPVERSSLVQAGKTVELQGHHFVMLECASRS